MRQRVGRAPGKRIIVTYKKYKIIVTYHELGNHAVEGGALVSEALLSRAEGAEVLGGAGHHIGAEGHLDAADGAATGRHVKENDGVRHRGGGGKKKRGGGAKCGLW